MSKNKRKRRNINQKLLADLIQAQGNFAVIGGTREPHEKLELAIAVARLIEPHHWTVVSRAQLDPGQFPFPDLLLKRFPGKRVFVVFTIESFLPDFHQRTKGDLWRTWSKLCIEEDIRIIAIIGGLEEDNRWAQLSERGGPSQPPALIQ